MSSASADSMTDSAPRKRLHAVSQRRQNKPLIEKRRRARINQCLLQLKALLMKDHTTETPRPSKLEKADILEMTVDYIKKIAHRKTESADRRGPADKAEGEGVPFVRGFSRCLEEVESFLDDHVSLLPDVRHKLLSHCKEQLSAREETVAEASPARSTTLPPVTPFLPAPLDDELLGRSRLTDSASELSSDDEVKVRTFGDLTADDVKPDPTETSCAAAATAFVTPFQHCVSSSSSSSSSACLPSTTQQKTCKSESSGMNLAGPLKLICGGNVFIVVDQQQTVPREGTAATDVTLHPQTSPNTPASAAPSLCLQVSTAGCTTAASTTAHARPPASSSSVSAPVLQISSMHSGSAGSTHQHGSAAPLNILIPAPALRPPLSAANGVVSAFPFQSHVLPVKGPSTALHPLNLPPSTLGPVVHHSSAFPAAFATCFPYTVPYVSSYTSANVRVPDHSASAMETDFTCPPSRPPPADVETEKTTSRSPGPSAAGSSPPLLQHAPEASPPSAGGDVNNNVMNNPERLPSPVWRPW